MGSLLDYVSEWAQIVHDGEPFVGYERVLVAKPVVLVAPLAIDPVRHLADAGVDREEDPAHVGGEHVRKDGLLGVVLEILLDVKKDEPLTRQDGVKE